MRGSRLDEGDDFPQLKVEGLNQPDIDEDEYPKAPKEVRHQIRVRGQRARGLRFDAGLPCPQKEGAAPWVGNVAFEDFRSRVLEAVSPGFDRDFLVRDVANAKPNADLVSYIATLASLLSSRLSYETVVAVLEPLVRKRRVKVARGNSDQARLLERLKARGLVRAVGRRGWYEPAGGLAAGLPTLRCAERRLRALARSWGPAACWWSREHALGVFDGIDSAHPLVEIVVTLVTASGCRMKQPQVQTLFDTLLGGGAQLRRGTAGLLRLVDRLFHRGAFRRVRRGRYGADLELLVLLRDLMIAAAKPVR